MILLHFGALHAGKDLTTVIHALDTLPSVTLIHAGKITSGSLPDKLPDKVVIKDYYITEQEKRELFDQADAVLLSYKSTFQQTASMLWDAMSYLKPVIASETTELRYLVKKYAVGYTFTPGNVESCREAIYAMTTLSGPEKEYIRYNCENFCQDYSMENWAKRFKEIAESLCGLK